MVNMNNTSTNSGHVRLIGKVHGKLVHHRRVAVLAERLAAMLPACTKLLDVGCGDGTISALVSQKVSGLAVTGVEFAPRASCVIPCTGFDGAHLPFPDKSFDGCMFVDVLHHSRDPLTILRDAARVCRSFILIKDHLAENALDHWTLRLMDWVGNKPHGVVLPFAYLSGKQWEKLYNEVGLTERKVDRAVPLYPAPFSFIFGRKLHFVSLLTLDRAPKE
jgi:SAM-dependent methyltransferase